MSVEKYRIVEKYAWWDTDCWYVPEALVEGEWYPLNQVTTEGKLGPTGGIYKSYDSPEEAHLAIKKHVYYRNRGEGDIVRFHFDEEGREI